MPSIRMKALRHGLPLLLTYLRFAVATFAGGSNSTTRIGNRRSLFSPAGHANVPLIQRQQRVWHQLSSTGSSGGLPSATAHEEPSPNQWITNKTPQPNANTRRRTSAKIPIITDFSGRVARS